MDLEVVPNNGVVFSLYLIITFSASRLIFPVMEKINNQ